MYTEIQSTWINPDICKKLEKQCYLTLRLRTKLIIQMDAEKKMNMGLERWLSY